MAATFLIGTAPDGPTGQFVTPSSVDSALRMYGWQTTEIFTLPASATSVTLKSPVFGSSLSISKLVNGKLLPGDLMRASVSGNIVSFTTRMCSGEYVFTYVPVQDQNSLLLDALVFSSTYGSIPTLVKVGGTSATLAFPEITFTSKYTGSKYNDTVITVDLTSVYITVPSSPLQKTFTYQKSSDINDLVQAIKGDVLLGNHFIDMQISRNVTINDLPIGTWKLSGGTDGKLDYDSFYASFNGFDFDSIDNIVLCGVCSSGDIEAIADYIHENSTSCCLIAGGPAEFRYGTYDDVDYANFLNSLSWNYERLFFVPGYCYVSPGDNYTNEYYSYTWVPLSTKFASIYDMTPTVVHTELGVIDITPRWTKDQLNELGNKCVVSTRFIQTGYGFYRARTTGGRNTIFTSVCQEVVHRVAQALYQFVGETNVKNTSVNTALQETLPNIPNVRQITFSSYVENGYIYVSITILIAGEVEIMWWFINGYAF